MRFQLLAACLTLTPLLVSQTPSHVVPNDRATREGDARHWVPTHVAPSRAQSTYRHSAIAMPTGNIHRLSLRPDSGTTAPMAQHTWAITIHLSSQEVPTPNQLSNLSYSANRGLDRVRVVDRQAVNFPGHTPTGNSPQPWRVSIPVQPFAYVSGRNLQIEWDVDDPAPSSGSRPWFADAHTFSTQSSGGYFVRDRISNACPSTGTTYGGEAGGPGSTAAVWFYSQSGPNLPAVFALGADDQNWAGTPLPFDLGAFGFTGCQLWCEQLLTVGGRTDANSLQGRFRIDMVLPNFATLAGTDWFTQNFVLDPSFGNGLRASDKGRIRIGNVVPPIEAKHLYSYQAAISDLPEFNSPIGLILGIN